MKKLIALLFSVASYGQNCDCNSKPELKEIISCKQDAFSNGATLSWQFDCNSSKLIFKKAQLKKTIFELESNFMELTGRLGYSNWTEFNKTFLIENRLVSGCCDPSEFILFDKYSGNIIRNLGTLIFKSSSKDKRPFIISLKNLTTILITNLATNNIRTVKLPHGRLANSLKYSNQLFANSLFEKPIVTGNFLIVNYKYQDSGNHKWKISTIKINL